METKLTCGDLMIGDWAKLSKGNWSEIRQLELIDIEMIAEGVYFAEAIPLTAEILEKNGLKNYEEYPEYKIKTNEFEIWVIFDEPQNCVHVEKYDKGIPTIYHNKIMFVHELQHALRLCGINDKEIVL